MSEPLRLRVNNEIPAYRPGLVAALDVGSSKIACVIGRAEQGSLKILGSALRESAGVRAGTITSLELAEESIRDCVAAAENHADARIQNVLISVSCGAPVSVTALWSRTSICASCCRMGARAAAWTGMRLSKVPPPPMWWTRRGGCAIRPACFASASAFPCMLWR